MKLISIASSSKGNCTIVSDGEVNILIDCGTSAKQVALKSELDSFDALFISHEHSDHIGGAGVMGRKYNMPIYIHEDSHKAIKKGHFKNCDVHFWAPGEDITIGKLTIHNFTSRHDSVYSYGFIVESEGKKLGYLTDSGSISRLMRENLTGCDAYFLEADYEHDTLMNHEDYDPLLKERISSDWGHLSNDQIVKFLEELDIADSQPEFIVFGHLSDKTNSPEIVLKKVKKTFPKWDMKNIHIAPLTSKNILTL